MKQKSPNHQHRYFLATMLLLGAGFFSACGGSRSGSEQSEDSSESSVNSTQGTQAAAQADSRSFTQPNQRAACQRQEMDQWVDSALESDPERRFQKDLQHTRTVNDCTNIELRVIERQRFDPK